MTKISNPIVFFGSGPVAAESLRKILQDFEVEAVVTKPSTVDEMQKIASTVPVYTTANKAELDQLISEKQFSSQLGILIDFGIIVSQKVISSFPLGIINSHFSILPEWRGADPISFAILSGQKKTGVSLMLLVEAMDEGPLLGYGEQPLTGQENSSQLTETLINLSHALLLHEVPRLLHGETSDGAPQSITKRAVSYSRKLTKKDGILDFTKTARELEAEIRAFIEWPKSHTEIAGKDVVILSASVDTAKAGPIGVIYKTDNKNIGIYTSSGSLVIESLKPAGKNAMSAEAFLAGYGLSSRT